MTKILVQHDDGAEFEYEDVEYAVQRDGYVEYKQYGSDESELNNATLVGAYDDD